MKDPTVEAWFEKYENPMKPLVLAVRDLILEANPRMTETIKWQAPTFVYKGNLASFYPKSRQHVSLMFHTGAQIPGNFPSLEGSGEVSRVMKFIDLEDLRGKEEELKAIVAAWIAAHE
jgi:hypothetical protein